MEQKIPRFSWFLGRVAGVHWVLCCWSDTGAKLPHNCVVEITQKNKYFHALIMCSFASDYVFECYCYKARPQYSDNLYIIWLGRVQKKNRSGFHFFQSWESLRSLKRKIKPTKPSSPPYPPQGAEESRGFLGNYSDNLPCLLSGVLIQVLGASSTNIVLF